MEKKKKVMVYKTPKAQDGMETEQGQPQAPPQQQGQPPQQGGADPMQQAMQMAQQMAQEGADPMQIVQALMEQGVPPEAVGQILVQLGMPEEQVQQVMQQIMQQAQQGAPQGQPMMDDGGEAGANSILNYMANGGQAEQPQGGGDQMQQIMQMAQQMAQEGAEPAQIVQALMEQGVPPEAVAQVLVQLGMPEEQVQQVMQQIMQQAQGQQGPLQEGAPQQEGQPMMAIGGEQVDQASQQEQIQQLIMMFAKMQGQDPEEILKALQEMPEEEAQQALQQMAETVQGASQGANQAPSGMPLGQEQIMASYGGESGKYHTMPDGTKMLGSSHGVSSQEELEYMVGGGKKDFAKIAKEKIKKYRSGGATDANSISSDTTEEHVKGLNLALTNFMGSGQLINSVKERYGNMSDVFDQLPKADKGLELRNKALRHLDYNQDDYDTDPAKKTEVDAYMKDITAGYAARDLAEKNNTGFDLGEADLLAKDKKTAERNAWIDSQINSGSNNSSQGNREFLDAFGNPIDDGSRYKQGWNAYGNPNSYNRGNSGFSAFSNLFNSVKGTPRYNFDGYGNMSGKDFNDFTKMVGKDGDYEITSVDTVNKKKRFGPRKGQDKKTLFGNTKIDENSIRVNTKLRNPVNTPGVGDGKVNNSAYKTREEIEAEYTTEEGNSIYDNDEIQREIDREFALQDKNGIYPPALSATEASNKRARERKAASPNSQWDYKNIDELVILSGLDPNQSYDPDYVFKIAGEKGILGDKTQPVSRPSTQYDADAKAEAAAADIDRSAYRPHPSSDLSYDPTGEESSVNETNAEAMESADAKDAAAKKAAGLEGKPESEWTDEDYDNYDANYQYMNGGSIQEFSYGGQLGSPFKWNGNLGRFIPKAEVGLDGAIVSQKNKRSASDIYGSSFDLLNWGNDKLDSAYSILDYQEQNNKGTDWTANVDRESDEGIYSSNLANMLSDQRGENSILTGQSDFESFRQNYTPFNSPIVGSNNPIVRNGGLIKGARGMEKGSEHILTKAQEGMLIKAGYKLKKLF